MLSLLAFPRTLAREIQELYKFRWVSISMVSSSLKTRYKRSFFGFLWSLLGPILNYLVVGIVFSLMMKGSVQNYFVYMFAGTVIFNLLSVTISHSTASMLGNENYIKKMYLPKSLFVVNTVALEYINFILALTALTFLGVVFQKLTLNWAYLFLPIPLISAFFFNFGIASFVSVTSVFFRDMVHVLPILLQAAFFGTPILYNVELIPERFQKYLMLNPFYYFVEAFRYPIYKGELPPTEISVGLFVLSVTSFVIGFLLLKKFENKIVFRL